MVFDVYATGHAARDITTRLKERGILLNGINERLMRAVTHRDVTRQQCEEAAAELTGIVTA